MADCLFCGIVAGAGPAVRVVRPPAGGGGAPDWQVTVKIGFRLEDAE